MARPQIHKLPLANALNILGQHAATVDQTPDNVLSLLIQALVKAQVPTPFSAQSKAVDLVGDKDALLYIINATFFPDGGGLRVSDVGDNDTVGDVAKTIATKLND